MVKFIDHNTSKQKMNKIFYGNTVRSKLFAALCFLFVVNIVIAQDSLLCRGDYTTEAGGKAMLANFQRSIQTKQHG